MVDKATYFFFDKTWQKSEFGFVKFDEVPYFEISFRHLHPSLRRLWRIARRSLLQKN